MPDDDILMVKLLILVCTLIIWRLGNVYHAEASVLCCFVALDVEQPCW